MSSKSVKPGQPAPASGQYRPKSGGPEITLPKGHIAPPSPKPKTPWVMVDPTKNKSGTGK
jgi:hypothetical protein